jgi:hypothetical protein
LRSFHLVFCHLLSFLISISRAAESWSFTLFYLFFFSPLVRSLLFIYVFFVIPTASLACLLESRTNW